VSDHSDADLSLDAVIDTFGNENPPGRTIEDLWRCKGTLVRERMRREGQPAAGRAEKAGPTLYLTDLPEFAPLIGSLAARGGVQVERSIGYVSVTSAGALHIRRAETGLRDAIWFAILVAGFDGRIALFDDRDLKLEL
jgi:hypothetical protein